MPSKPTCTLTRKLKRGQHVRQAAVVQDRADVRYQDDADTRAVTHDAVVDLASIVPAGGRRTSR